MTERKKAMNEGHLIESGWPVLRMNLIKLIKSTKTITDYTVTN